MKVQLKKDVQNLSLLKAVDFIKKQHHSKNSRGSSLKRSIMIMSVPLTVCVVLLGIFHFIFMPQVCKGLFAPREY